MNKANQVIKRPSILSEYDRLILASSRKQPHVWEPRNAAIWQIIFIVHEYGHRHLHVHRV